MELRPVLCVNLETEPQQGDMSVDSEDSEGVCVFNSRGKQATMPRMRLR